MLLPHGSQGILALNDGFNAGLDLRFHLEVFRSQTVILGAQLPEIAFYLFDVISQSRDTVVDASGHTLRLVTEIFSRLPGLFESGSQLVAHQKFYLDWFHLLIFL